MVVVATAILDRPIERSDLSDFDAVLNEVAGHLNAQHARLVDLTVTVLENEELWLDEGLHTPEAFLAWRTGLGPHNARHIVAIARRARELPECVEAFRRGELSVDQMAAIAHRAPWWSDSEICDLAKMLTVGQLRRTLGRYPFPEIPSPYDDGTGSAGDDCSTGTRGDENDAAGNEPAAGEPAAGEPAAGESAPGGASPADAAGGEPVGESGRGAARIAGLPGPDATPSPGRMWWGIGDDGVFRLRLECDPLVGMIIDAALGEARDALFQAGHTDVTDIDAIQEVAQRSLDSINSAARRDRFRINIHLRTDATAGDTRGWVLPDAIRQHITCDGLLSPVFIDGGIPISVGRTQRMIPQRTRLVVLLRDQCCRVPGCDATHHLEIHHIIHWEHDGPTDTWNLVALCPHHHRMHHRGDLSIVGNADTVNGLVFANRHGRPIGTTGAKPEPPGAPPSHPAGCYQHPLGERLEHKWVYFNPPPEHRQRPRTAQPAHTPSPNAADPADAATPASAADAA